MAPLPIVLLPGLDGTGELFEPFLPALPPELDPIVVRYPRHEVLGYDELVAFARRALPDEPFLLLGESFSGPVAMRLAASAPPGLVGLVLVATFHRRPVGAPLAWLRPFVGPALFSRPPPAMMIRRLLAGGDAPRALVDAFRASIGSVSGAVVARRVEAVLDVDVTEALSRVRVPTLYLAAEREGLLRRGMPGDLRAILESLEVTSLPTPHLVLQREPAAAAAAIAELARRVSR